MIESSAGPSRTRKALTTLDFLVVQDCFLTETAALAHVVLPSVTFAEKEGTFTNVERRVQRVRAALQPNGEAKPDLWIFQELAKAFGAPWRRISAKSVMDEIRGLVPLYGGMDYARLEFSGLQWPCPLPDHPGTSILYEKDFHGKKGKFTPVELKEAINGTESDFFLITGPTLFHSGTLSAMSPGLMGLQGESFVEMYLEDAHRLGLPDGQKVNLISEYGQVTVRIVVSKKAAPGVLFIPYHFRPNGAHQLTGWDLDISRVKIGKIE